MSANKPYHYQSAGELVVTTTGNIDNLDVEGCALLLMNNASLSTIRGIKAGYPGQRVTIASIGAGRVDLAHQNVSSTAANRLLNRATSAASPLGVGQGVASYQYDSTTARWRMVHHDSGWISVAHDGANFTASAGTWTVESGDQVTYSYRLVGKSLVIAIYVQSSTVSVSAELRVAIPASLISANYIRQMFQVFPNGVPGFGVAYVGNGDTVVHIGSDAAVANFPAGTNNTYVIGTIEIEVQ